MYLGTTITHQNHINEEIKNRLNSENIYSHGVQKRLSLHLGILFCFVTVINFVSNPKMRKLHRLKVFDKVLRRIFGPDKVQVRGR
jgi:hypothetical protein